MWPGSPRSAGMRARSCSNGGRISPRSSATIHSTRSASSGPTFRPRAAKKRSTCSLRRRPYPRPASHFYYRRPSPGFHPHVYAFENKDRYDAALINPLAHFIRSGKPEGPWKSEVISPRARRRDRPQPGHEGRAACAFPLSRAVRRASGVDLLKPLPLRSAVDHQQRAKSARAGEGNRQLSARQC